MGNMEGRKRGGRMEWTTTTIPTNKNSICNKLSPWWLLLSSFWGEKKKETEKKRKAWKWKDKGEPINHTPTEILITVLENKLSKKGSWGEILPMSWDMPRWKKGWEKWAKYRGPATI